MAVERFTVGEGDTDGDLVVTLKDGSGSAVDVTGATIVFSMRHIRTRKVAVKEQSVSLTTPGSGIVTYSWQSGDTDEDGEYYGQFRVTYSGGDVQRFPNKIDGENAIIITVGESITWPIPTRPLEQIKGKLRNDIESHDSDAELMRYAIAQSRVVDDHVRTHFYDQTRTRTLTAKSGYRLLIPDLISVTTLKADTTGDRTFNETWDSTDYILHNGEGWDAPTDGLPTSRPYRKLEVDSYGTKGAFPCGHNRVQVVGSWGWWRKLKRVTDTLGEALDASETGVDITNPRTDIQAGHTILVDSEQMFVESYEADTLTVIRGVNGTTAASHSSGASIDIYEYPPEVTEAVIELVSRSLVSRGSNIRLLDDNTMQVDRPMNWKALLDRYKRMVA